MSSGRRVVLGDLPVSERERFYEFLVANKIEFIADQSGEIFVATIRVKPPEASTARLSGRSRTAAISVSNSAARPESTREAMRSNGKQAGSLTSATYSTDATATLKGAQSVLRRRYTRFCNLLPPLQAAPKKVRRTALVRFADDVYDARYEKDALFLENEKSGRGKTNSVQSFPDFVYDFISKRYGLKALLSNYSWGMISSVELMRNQDDCVELFGKFLEETYDSVDLMFFLFTRDVIQKVINRQQKGGLEEQDEDSDAVEGVKKKDSKYVPKDVIMDAGQIRKALGIALATNAKLRDKIKQTLDSFMDERMIEPGSKAALGLDTNFVLKIAVEAYHASRESHAEEQKVEIARNTLTNEREDTGSNDNMSPEMRKEVRQVTQRLVAALSAQGVEEVNPQSAYEWAMAVTLRRHKVGDYAEQPARAGGGSSMVLDDMKAATLSLMKQPEQVGHADAFVPSEDVLGLSSKEFEENLESNVRQLLMNAVSELAMEAINSLPGNASKDERVRLLMKSILIKEFAPTADILMETIVSKDYRKWLDTLNIEGNGSTKHRQQFEKLHERFSEVLNTDINATIVQSICRDVVSGDELFGMMEKRGADLSTLAEANKLVDMSPEGEEMSLEGTASFGDE